MSAQCSHIHARVRLALLISSDRLQINNPLDVSNFDAYPKDGDVPPDELSGWDSEFWHTVFYIKSSLCNLSILLITNKITIYQSHNDTVYFVIFLKTDSFLKLTFNYKAIYCITFSSNPHICMSKLPTTTNNTRIFFYFNPSLKLTNIYV